ncbi:hypothetical protein EIQ10_07890 [Xanthomonas campestris pv. campestris]
MQGLWRHEDLISSPSTCMQATGICPAIGTSTGRHACRHMLHCSVPCSLMIAIFICEQPGPTGCWMSPMSHHRCADHVRPLAARALRTRWPA